MAGGGRSAGRQIGIRPSSVSYKVFVSAVFTLIFLAALSVLLSSNSSSTADNSAAALLLRPYVSGTFLALKSDPLGTRLDLIYKQATDHIALVNAYSSYARRLKLDNSRLLRTFEDLASSFSDLVSRFDAAVTSSSEEDARIDEEALRSFEKEVKDKVKLARLLISESKESFDTQLKIQKLRDTIFAVNEQLHKARKLGGLSSSIAAGSTPKSLHCLSMRLMEERVINPKPYVDHYRLSNSHPSFEDPELYHYALFSDNIVAAAVVINSAIKNAAKPRKHVFHLVTDSMNLAAFQVWFRKRPPPGGARVEIRSTADFRFLNSSYSPIVRLIEGGRADLTVLDHLKFYLPEMYPKLRRIVYLEDDVVVQRDLAGLSSVDLDGRVNGAVETCFGPFRRFSRYVNFSNPGVQERFNPKACAWAFGVNVFDLDAWRRDKCTDEYHKYLNLNEDGTLWNQTATLPIGLLTFYMNTMPLEKTWHVMGLGYNPSISPDEISNAAVIHFDGNMKPWLDIAMNQYKNLWMKYVDTDMEYLQLCNFGI